MFVDAEVLAPPATDELVLPPTAEVVAELPDCAVAAAARADSVRSLKCMLSRYNHFLIDEGKVGGLQ